MKVTKLFSYKDDVFTMALEASNIDTVYWFDRYEIIPASWIYAEYREKNYIYDEEDICKEDAIMWWNNQLNRNVFKNLLLKYPPEKKGFQKAIDIFSKMELGRKSKVYADLEERERFYSSFDWSYVKYLRFMIDRGICQRCGIKPQIPEVNHLYPIASEKYPAFFIRNLDINRVETLCPGCHDFFHAIHKNEDIFFI
jgi:hypothetical protein